MKTRLQELYKTLQCTVFERGWLSSNNVLFHSNSDNALIDSGYCTHSAQTLQLVRSVLHDQPLQTLVNTHLHSDHCGGNAILQATYPSLQTFIPIGQSEYVKHWDPVRLSFTPTGQNCPQFAFSNVLKHGDIKFLGDREWRILSSPGHDPHSVILFEPLSKTLISADALWRNGFGVVFQELDGVDAFDHVASTLALIETLNPSTVIPGHGSVFSGLEVADALSVAQSRLAAFRANPMKHTRYAIKVLIKYKLLEWQCISRSQFDEWTMQTPYLQMVHHRFFSDIEFHTWTQNLIADLVQSGAAKVVVDEIFNI